MFPRKQCVPFGSTRAVRAGEDEESIVRTPEPVPTLMHEPMVETAERDEIGELRLPAVDPVRDVVTVGRSACDRSQDIGNRRRELSAPG